MNGNPSTFDGVRVATIMRKDGNEELRVELREYNGRAYVDVRNWWTPQDTGEKRPGKGVTIKVRELGDVADALERAARMVDRNGRIVPERADDTAAADPTASW